MTNTDTAGGDYAATNVAHWNRHADAWVEAGERLWMSEPEWGIWGVPNSEVPLIADDMTGFSAIELGCGTGYGSAWMARRGAAVVGIDPSIRQLETARRLASEHDIEIRFVQALAESVPFPAESFDFALSEYGAAIWADPHAWIPEAHRILRHGGRLAFLGTGSWNDVFTPRALDGLIGETAIRSYFGMHRIEWVGLDDDPSIEFNLPISAWFRLLRTTGFEVDGFYEIQAPDDVDDVRFGIDPEWARKYPSEQAWIVRKVG
ncbi:MAG TPA: class I SAM-dependent methyltransferase [Acidimicrobiia bacterium]|nr:class I SAM-dependent methyltransferase [Acidimicrobiia bacterium]